jgi:hypothetical protein
MPKQRWNASPLFAFMRFLPGGERRGSMSKARFGFVVCLSAMVWLSAGFSSAQAERGRWQINGPTASLLSSNTLSIGNRSIEYHPVLIIGCQRGREDGWSKSVRLRDSLSGNGTIDVSVRLDRSESSETWRLGNRNSSFSFDGKDGVARLLRAKRFRLGWSNGFFSGTGEAIFSLAGIEDVVSQLAATCGVASP